VATSESSSTAAASDRTADGSQDGTSCQPFAAALARAQADTDRKPGSQRAAVTAAIEEAHGESAASRIAAEARHDTQTSASRTASPIKSNPSSGDVAANVQTPMAIAVDSAADDAAVTHGRAAKLESRADGTATSTATRTKSRAGKPLPTTPALDGAALSALSALLGAPATSTGVTAPATSTPESSAQRTVRNVADAASASAPPSVAKHPLSLGVPTAAGATASTSISPLAAHAATNVSNSNGASANSFAAARVEGDHGGSTALGTGLAPMLQSLNTATSTATASPTAGIGVPVAHSNWPNALAAQLQWMATRQVQSATLRLSPEHLGPLEVRIDVTRSQININFTAHHPDTRDALAQAVPQLRQLFAAGGLNLGEATVQQEPRSSEQSLLPQRSSATTTSETVEPVANAATQRLGLVDEYA
jgi:flagellar hook-length control protein FliK